MENWEPPSRCPKCDTPFLLYMAEVETFGEHICLEPAETTSVTKKVTEVLDGEK